LSESVAGRGVPGPGYLAVLPGAGPPVVVLRPGDACMSVGDGRPLIAAVDFDRSGAATVSGTVRPGQSVRIALDGQEAGEDRADGAGVYAAPLSKALRPGPHMLTAVAGAQQATVSFEASRPAVEPGAARAG